MCVAVLLFPSASQIKDPSGISYYPTTLADWSKALWHPMSYDVSNTTSELLTTMKVGNGNCNCDWWLTPLVV